MGWAYVKINYICDSKAGGKQLIICVSAESRKKIQYSQKSSRTSIEYGQCSNFFKKNQNKTKTNHH